MYLSIYIFSCSLYRYLAFSIYVETEHHYSTKRYKYSNAELCIEICINTYKIYNIVI